MQRAARLGRDLTRNQALQTDIAAPETELAELLEATDGQILTTMPGVGVGAVRAAAFAAHALPIDRFPDAEHLYSATGLAPACMSRRPSTAAGGSPARAWPSTATR